MPVRRAKHRRGLAQKAARVELRPLDDTDPIKFGKHIGESVGRVSSNYLLYLWNSGIHEALQKDNHRGELARYIEKHLNDLAKDCPDVIVDKV